MKNKEIQHWFLNLDESLNINKWITSYKSMNRNQNEPIGKAILNNMQKTLGDIISNLSANAVIEPPSHPHNPNITGANYAYNRIPCKPCYNGIHGNSSYQPQASDARHNPMTVSTPIYHVLILPYNNNTYIINFC